MRIATGYFSIGGFAALRPSFEGTRTHVLVGFDESAQATLRENLVEEILEELRHWHADRYAVVQALANDLGQSLRLMNARTRANDHAKVYIVDERTALVGSPNLSTGGLRRNTEAATAVTDSTQVAFWVTQFDFLWDHPDTHDITEELRERLLDFLRLRPPWEIYLKAASVLLRADQPTKPSAHYREPAEFQMVVVRRVLKQLRDADRRGALIVASTGLGKTIMATHTALELHRKGLINQVIVFAPTNVHPEWKRRLASARVRSSEFTIDLLNRKRGPAVDLVDDALADGDDQTLIIIDEAHRFRNRFRSTGGEPLAEKRAFERIEKATARTGCRVLLLTATPFATSAANINNQLRLLPHTSRSVPSDRQQTQLALYETYPWTVASVEELIESDVATVLNAPFVARVFGRHDEDLGAEYLEYPNGDRQYFPAVYLGRVETPLPFHDRLAPLLDGRLLRHAPRSVQIDGQWRKADNLIERKATMAWASSPPALASTLRGVANGTYQVDFSTPEATRTRELAPLIDALDALDPVDDKKLGAARRLIQDARLQDRKVVLFTERYETAAYLLKGVKDLVPEGRIACVVAPSGDALELEPSAALRDLVEGFAPVSNRRDDGRELVDGYDVLIATDALAEGINLQDASVLINYDLAWTPDVIIQRAGRIMRLWHAPRTIRIYAFVPDPAQPAPLDAVSRMPLERLKRLEERLADASHLTELELLPNTGERTVARMSTLSTLRLLETDELGSDFTHHPDLQETTQVLNDYSTYLQHRRFADELPDDIATARHARHIRGQLVVTIVHHNNEYVAIEYDPAKNHVREIADDLALRHLRCDPDEPTEYLTGAQIDHLRFRTIDAWRRAKGIPETAAVGHVCTAVLIESPNPAHLFQES